jgi:hypothetical protein
MDSPIDHDVQKYPSSGNFVVVEFATKKRKLHYVGFILGREGEGSDEWTVKFMRKVAGSSDTFVFPDQDDISPVNLSDIKDTLLSPIVGNRFQHTFPGDLKAYSFK